jgi:hypothetical protein
MEMPVDDSEQLELSANLCAVAHKGASEHNCSLAKAPRVDTTYFF